MILRRQQTPKKTLLLLTFGLTVSLTHCSSAPKIQSLAYAHLSPAKFFAGAELPALWHAIETVASPYKVTRRDPSEANPLELKRRSRCSLETDWTYGQSREQAIVTQHAGTVQRIRLQNRFLYQITAEKTLGGVQVTVSSCEEVEGLNADGSSAGYQPLPAADVDSSRGAEWLSQIETAWLVTSSETPAAATP